MLRYKTKTIFKPILFIVDAIGNTLFFWTKLKKSPKKIKKILFIRLEHIGDVILATPCFESFKKNHADCEIHVLCKNLTAPLLKNNPFVDKIITYDAPWFNKRTEDKRKKLSELIKELKKEKYDVVFEMHGDPRNNYLAFRTGAYTIGYACRGGGFFLNKIAHYDSKKHTIKQNLSLLNDFCKNLVYKPKLFEDKEAVKKVQAIIASYNLKKFIIINPRSGRIEKDLTDEETIRFIKRNDKNKIIIVGSKAESDKNKIFEKFNNIINLTGKTDLLTLVELTKKAYKVIAPDTGIVHIANAVGTRCEAVYKTTSMDVWGYR